ncbi:MAG: cytochrome c3 family protein [Polyangiaceae bacterium]
MRRSDVLLGVVVLSGAFAGASCGELTSDDPHQKIADQDCAHCHIEEYKQATNPIHVGAMPTTCGDCHSEKAWHPSNFHHGFPLGGAHLTAKCNDCHTGDPPVYEGTPTVCYGCHKSDYENSPYPGHQTYPTTCQDCHSTIAWKPASPTEHPFPLAGAHASTPCDQCHVGNPPVYKGTPTVCVGCHKSDYDNSPYPGHQTFPTTCEQCHGTIAWVPASKVEHPWPLNGAHGAAACAECHVGNPPVYKGTPTNCVGCHKADYDSSPYPGHSTYPTTCDQCHGTNAWKPATPAEHPFPLDGAHAGTICAKCHTGNPPVYKGTPNTCVGCHKADYDSSPYPNHQTFATTCGDCHNTTAWKPATGGGHPETKFPVSTGAHSKFKCADCHNASLGPNGKGNADCVGCHTGTHARSKMDAKHKEVGKYPTGSAAPNFCLDCHPKGKN